MPATSGRLARARLLTHAGAVVGAARYLDRVFEDVRLFRLLRVVRVVRVVRHIRLIKVLELVRFMSVVMA